MKFSVSNIIAPFFNPSFFDRLKNWVITPVDKFLSPQVLFWFSLSILMTCFYAGQGLQEAFSSAYVIQDDARHHVFWTQRFFDSELFPKDLIADYLQATAPLGYTNFYHFFASLGIDPIWFSKIIPPALALVGTCYCYLVCLKICPIPASAFLGNLLCQQMLWEGATYISATPRAFMAIGFFAFVYYLLQKSLIPTLIAIAFQGLFYPPGVLISASVLIIRLFRWENGLPRLSLERKNFLVCLLGLAIIVVVVLPSVLKLSAFGPTLTLAEARQLPEFSSQGRMRFFTDNFWDYWFNGLETGLFILPLRPPILYLSFLLPILIRFRSRFILLKQNEIDFNPLIQIFIGSLGLFLLAHATLFKFYNPSRYSLGVGFSLRMITGIILIVILAQIFKACENPDAKLLKVWYFVSFYLGGVGLYYWVYFFPYHKKLLLGLIFIGTLITLIGLFLDKIPLNNSLTKGGVFIAFSSTLLILITIFNYPNLAYEWPKTDYIIGTEPELYQFLKKQPKDILIASLSLEADNLPSFARRSILVSREYSFSFHKKYYHQLHEKIIDLIEAQYATDLAKVKALIKKYNISFLLLDNNAFTQDYFLNPSSLTSRWLRQYKSTSDEALKHLNQDDTLVLSKLINQCTVFKNERLTLLNAQCILNVN